MGKLPEDYERDYVSRTIANLKIIEKSVVVSGEGFEVTQLINSLLGLVVMLKERGSNPVWEKMKLKDPRASFLPPPEVFNRPCVQEVGEYIRLVRNGIAHFNIEFLDDGREITGLRISNKSNGITTHCFQYNVQQLREFACKFPRLQDKALAD